MRQEVIAHLAFGNNSAVGARELHIQFRDSEP